MTRLTSLVVLLLVASSTLGAEIPRIVPQTGHIDSISSMAIHGLDGALVTASHDGSLRIWETSTRKLKYKMQVSALPLVDMVLHPDKPRAAVIESDGISIHRLSIWDWSEHRRIFSRELQAMPTYLSFSPAGTFLAYSIADWQSMTVINANSGVRLPYIRNGFGIVSGFRISSSEERILTYLPSGSIQYRNLRSGTLIQEFPTIADVLEPIFVMSNRYMLGRWEDNLMAIDLLSGEDVGSVRVPNLLSFSANPETGDVLCLVESSEEENGLGYLSYSFSGSTFRSRYNRYKPPEGLSANDTSGRTVYAGTEDGDLFYQTTYSSSPRPFSTSKLAAVHDFDSSSGLILTTTESIITIYADYLYDNISVRATNPVLSHTQANPLGSAAQVTSVGDGVYVLQDDSGEVGRYWLFSPVEGAIGLPNDLYEAPILTTSTKDRRILTVDESGTIQIFSLFRNDFEFETQAFGLKTAIFADGDHIVAGGRRSQSLRTSKLLVDTITGESVPFDDDSLETFQLAYEPLSHSLYSLSVEGSATDPKTVLAEHSGQIFENSRVLYSMAGKHADATMSVGRSTLFFSSAGVNRALYAGTGRFMPVDGNDNIPVKVQVIDDWFLALNRDSSLSVWHRATGAHALDFYLFEDLEWVAVTASGEILSSTSRTDAYVREYQ
jgi:WD40 repeat protein